MGNGANLPNIGCVIDTLRSKCVSPFNPIGCYALTEGWIKGEEIYQRKHRGGRTCNTVYFSCLSAKNFRYYERQLIPLSLPSHNLEVRNFLKLLFFILMHFFRPFFCGIRNPVILLER